MRLTADNTGWALALPQQNLKQEGLKHLYFELNSGMPKKYPGRNIRKAVELTRRVRDELFGDIHLVLVHKRIELKVAGMGGITWSWGIALSKPEVR